MCCTDSAATGPRGLTRRRAVVAGGARMDMDGTMARTDAENSRNLGSRHLKLVRDEGGAVEQESTGARRWSHREGLTPRGDGYRLTPELWLDREIASAFAGLCDGVGTTHGIYDAAEGKQWPHRKLAKRLREARAAGRSYQRARRVVEILGAYVDLLWEVRPDRAA